MTMETDDTFRAMELGMQGYNCSQILLLLALEAQKKENPDLIRAMNGLLAGLGCGKTCGVLTGGCCLLGLYAGKGSAEKDADENLSLMLTTFVEWFEAEYGTKYGGINCDDVMAGDMRNRLARCPSMVLESMARLKEILAENGYAFAAE